MTSAAPGLAAGSLLSVHADARHLEVHALAGFDGFERLLAGDIPWLLRPGDPGHS